MAYFSFVLVVQWLEGEALRGQRASEKSQKARLQKAAKETQEASSSCVESGENPSVQTRCQAAGKKPMPVKSVKKTKPSTLLTGGKLNIDAGPRRHALIVSSTSDSEDLETLADRMKCQRVAGSFQ